MESNINFNTPITNEELAGFYIADQNTQRDYYTKLLQTAKDIITQIFDQFTQQANENNRLNNERYTEILLAVKEQEQKLNTAVNVLADNMANMQKAITGFTNTTTEVIKTVATAQNENKAVEKKVADKKVIKDKSYDINSFVFKTQLSEEERENWRKKMRTQVNYHASISGMNSGTIYNMIYDNMMYPAPYTIHDLHRRYGKSLHTDNPFRTIATSDELMKKFESTLNDVIHGACKNIGSSKKVQNKPVYRAKSTIANVCPAKIKTLAKKLSATGSVNPMAIRSLYELLPRTEIQKLVSDVKKKTGYKNVNIGVAILSSPEAYKHLEELVNFKINNRMA